MAFSTISPRWPLPGGRVEVELGAILLDEVAGIAPVGLVVDDDPAAVLAEGKVDDAFDDLGFRAAAVVVQAHLHRHLGQAGIAVGGALPEVLLPHALHELHGLGRTGGVELLLAQEILCQRLETGAGLGFWRFQGRTDHAPPRGRRLHRRRRRRRRRPPGPRRPPAGRAARCRKALSPVYPPHGDFVDGFLCVRPGHGLELPGPGCSGQDRRGRDSS